MLPFAYMGFGHVNRFDVEWEEAWFELQLPTMCRNSVEMIEWIICKVFLLSGP